MSGLGSVAPNPMIKVGTEYPRWDFIQRMIPCEPCVFTATDAIPLREYEGALFSELKWPSNSTLSEKATCVRVMSSQLLPLLSEYAQLRDHLQGYFWHQNHLIPEMTRMAATLQSLTQEAQNLKLREFVRDQAGEPSRPRSMPPSVISAPTSIASSIKEAQAAAASMRSQGPATFYPDRGHGCSGSVQGHGDPSREHGQEGIAPPMVMMMPNLQQVCTDPGCGGGQSYPGPSGGMPSLRHDAPSPGCEPKHSDPIGLVLHHLTTKGPDDAMFDDAPETGPDSLGDNMAGSSSGGKL